MLFDLFRGRRARIDPSVRLAPENPTLAEAKLKAWALSVGEIRSPDGGRYRIARAHRGTLPDVDFSIVVPVERPRRLGTLARRVLATILRNGRKAAVTTTSPLGEAVASTYMEDDRKADTAAAGDTAQGRHNSFPRAA